MNIIEANKVKSLTLWVRIALGVTLLCYLTNAFLGALNQDEGWYLYAARQMMEGFIPHKDFFFTQGKLMPAVYACFGWAWSFAGILGGRLFTALLAFLAICIASRTTKVSLTSITERKMGQLACIAFLGVNLWYTYFTTIPKTYALCSLGIAGALWALSQIRQSDNKLPNFFAVLAGVVLALLVDIRFSMGVLLPIVLAWLFWNRQQIGPKTWIWFSVAASVTIALLMLPELLFWREAFLEAQAFHAAREPLGMMGAIGCLARVMRFNSLLCFVLILLGWGWITRQFVTSHEHTLRDTFPLLWGGMAIALMAVHLLAPVPYDDYWVPAMLPLAMASAVLMQRLSLGILQTHGGAVLLFVALALTVCASPIAQDWLVAGHDRFWVQKKAKPDLFILRDVARQVRAEAARLGEDTLWTQDTYLAVEAGLRVPTGLEMGPFSKPQAFKPTSKLAVWSGYTYALSFPSLAPDPMRDTKIDSLRAAYGRILLTETFFGQGGTQLFVAERTMP